MKWANIRSPLLLLLASLAFFFLCDSLIFRSGLYSNLLGGNTLAGTLHYQMIREQARSRSAAPSVLVMGNSQFEHGFDFRAFDHAYPNPGFKLYRMDTPSTGLVVWYFTLKHIDPKQNKYNLIIIPLDDYQPEAFHGDYDNNNLNARFIAPFINLDDWLELTYSMESLKERGDALKLAALTSRNFSVDLQDLLLNPPKRIKSRKDILEHLAEWRQYTDNFGLGVYKDLKFDALGKLENCPTGYENGVCQAISKNLSTKFTEKEKLQIAIHNRNFYQQWITKIIDLYADSKTKLLFIKMPDLLASYPNLYRMTDKGTLMDLVPRGRNITFLAEDYFTDLSKPEYMHDLRHLGKPGRDIFTKKMGNYLVQFMTAGTKNVTN